MYPQLILNVNKIMKSKQLKFYLDVSEMNK